MNDVKKELVKVAGDMTNSKARIKERVRHQHAPKLKKPLRFMTMSVVVTLCLVSFIVVQLVEKDSKQMAQLFNDTQLTYFKDLERIMYLNEELKLENAYARYEQKLASYYYAQFLGFESTVKEIAAEKFQRYKELQDLPDTPIYAVFKDNGVDKYFATYIEPMLPMFVAEKKLINLYKERYPTFPQTMVQQIAEQDAIRYFNKHFTEEAQSFQEELGLEHYVNIPYSSPFVGTIVEVEDNAFLFVEGAIPEELEQLSVKEIIEKYANATWYPVEEGVSVKTGDYVEVSSSSSVSENSNIERYGLLHSMTIVDPTITTKLTLQNTNDVAQFLQQLNWKQDKASIVRPPDYSFMLDKVRVDVWVTHAKTLRLYALEYGEVNLGDKSSDRLKGLLGI
ncbi:DUF3221 domain-containing protein [Lysinibacillus sp. NPDC096418]|uniref:DUF3221 domain-containing protein n=1 Tax=Lysinibacillus sp. NPDC096418 TaxID=3364138 RepID=UPI003818EB57